MVASNLGSKNLSQRNILNQGFTVETKIWSAKIEKQKWGKRNLLGQCENVGQQKIKNIKELSHRKLLGHNFRFNTKI